jgi:Phage-related minor tail protein
MMDASVKIIAEFIDKASPELKRFQQNLSNTEKAALSFAQKVGYAFGAALGTASVALAAVVVKSAEAADQMGKAAQKAGVTVEEFSSIAYAAKLSGVSTETLSTAFNYLNKSMVEADNKTSKAAIAFKTLGISARDSAGNLKSPKAVLLELADAISKLPDGTLKSTLSMELLGKGGSQMVPFLNEGKKAIEELTAEAKALGVEISEQFSRNAQKFNDNVEKSAEAAKGLGYVFTNELIGPLARLSDRFVEWAKNSEGMKSALVFLGRALKLFLATLTGVVSGVVRMLDVLVIKWGAAFSLMTWQVLGMEDGRAADTMMMWLQDVSDAFGIVFEDMKAVMNDDDPAVEAMRKRIKALDDAAKKEQEVAAERRKAAEQARIDAEKDAERTQKEFDRTVEGLIKEADGFKNLTAVEKIQQQIRSGAFDKFSAQQRAKLLMLAEEVDKNEKLRDLVQKLSNAYVTTYGATNALGVQAAASAASFDKLVASGQNSAEIFNQMQQPVTELTKKMGELQLAHDEALKTGDNKQAAKLENDIIAVEKQLELYTQLATVREKYITQQQQINRDTSTWNSYFGETRNRIEEINRAGVLISDWFKAGKISAEEFATATDRLKEDKFALMRAGATSFQKKVADVAATLQSTFGDMFYNMMQGTFDDVGKMFKNLIDRMVADALAAKLAGLLFGDFGNTGRVSGTGGGLLTALMGGGGYQGIFRENGGPVTAGQPYIVGERRPELFVPQTNGTIMPDTSAIQGGSSNQINLSITAMDSQDVIRAMDKIKRPLTEMINGANKTYNMR